MIQLIKTNGKRKDKSSLNDEPYDFLKREMKFTKPPRTHVKIAAFLNEIIIKEVIFFDVKYVAKNKCHVIDLNMCD